MLEKKENNHKLTLINAKYKQTLKTIVKSSNLMKEWIFWKCLEVAN